MLVPEIFEQQIAHTGRAYLTAEDMTNGRAVLSIDEADQVDDGLYRLRVSLSIPLSERDIKNGVPFRKYTDSRGVTRIVNAGGLRATLLVAAHPASGVAGIGESGIKALDAAWTEGWTGNIGVMGPERLNLIPAHAGAGVVFSLVTRVNPNTGEETLGLTEVVLVDMTVGKLNNSLTDVSNDLESAKTLLANRPLLAKPVPANPSLAEEKPAATKRRRTTK